MFTSSSTTNNDGIIITSLESLVERFWEVEEPDEAPLSFTDESRCEEIFNQETYRDSSGRYVVPFPFRVSPTLLSSFITQLVVLQEGYDLVS